MEIASQPSPAPPRREIRREVVCEDALAWLPRHRPAEGCSVVTSLPDWSEFSGWTLQRWSDWFLTAAVEVLSSTPDDGVAIFFQTDIRTEENWVDKGFLCSLAARELGLRTLWHKAVCRVPAGHASRKRAAYAHLLCFSRQVRYPLTHATPDVLPEGGVTSWTRGMGWNACLAACRFIRSHTASHTLLDPFCGEGMTLAAANSVGLNALGVELSPKRARAARLQQKPGRAAPFNP